MPDALDIGVVVRAIAVVVGVVVMPDALDIALLVVPVTAAAGDGTPDLPMRLYKSDV